MAYKIFALLAVLVAGTGCNSKCDSAASIIEDKCGKAAGAETDTGEACEADSEILANCVTDNSDKTCAEIQAACYSQ